MATASCSATLVAWSSGGALMMSGAFFTRHAVKLDRRRLLRVAGNLATAALTAPLASRLALGQPRFAAFPFALGVASGDPLADGFVLWTRLAPDPLNGGGMPP